MKFDNDGVLDSRKRELEEEENRTRMGLGQVSLDPTQWSDSTEF